MRITRPFPSPDSQPKQPLPERPTISDVGRYSIVSPKEPRRNCAYTERKRLAKMVDLELK